MNTYTAIDIGSENIKILSLRQSAQDGSFSVTAKFVYPANGIKYGYITNPNDFSLSLKKALAKFSKENRTVLDEAFFSLSGFGLRSEKIIVEHQAASGIISEFDIEKIEKKALSQLKKITSNQHIIEKKVIRYILGGFEHFANPVGLSAKKFTTEFLFVTYPENNLTVLEEAIAQSGISVISFTPALLCSATTSTSDLDKKLGCALVDIGAETTSIVIYENNQPIHYHVFKHGSKNITEKISLSEKVDFSKADKIKKTKINPKKIDKIIKDNLEILAEKIAAEIKSAGKANILPGGVTLVGGGAKISHIEDIFKKQISLPMKKSLRNISDSKTDYHVCYGNIMLSMDEEKTSPNISMPKLPNVFKPIKKLLKKFMI